MQGFIGCKQASAKIGCKSDIQTVVKRVIRMESEMNGFIQNFFRRSKNLHSDIQKGTQGFFYGGFGKLFFKMQHISHFIEHQVGGSQHNLSFQKHVPVLKGSRAALFIGKPFEGNGASSLWQCRIRSYAHQTAKNVNHRDARSCLRRRNESNPAEGRPNFARKASIPMDALFMAILSFSRAFSRFSIRFFSFTVIMSSIQRKIPEVNSSFSPVV